MELNLTELLLNLSWDPKNQGLPKIDGMLTFFSSMDWSESWLYYLIGFYVLLFLFIYITRLYSAIQGFTFILLLLTVYIAEDINEYLANHHKTFTRHQYFDSAGLFISLFMSTPLLLASAFIVGNWFHQSTVLMSQVKQLQMQRQARQRRKSEQKKTL